eukprot:6471642-Amphidinium_carterae.1
MNIAPLHLSSKGQGMAGRSEVSRWLSKCDDHEALQVLQEFLASRSELLQRVVDWAVPNLVRVSSRVLEDGRLHGTIKSFSSSSGSGVVTSDELPPHFGVADLAFNGEQTRGRGHPDSAFAVGAHITFVVLMCNGGPQAFDLAPGSVAPRQGGIEQVAPQGERLFGTLRNYSAARKYGFLLCDEMAETMGRSEVFVHQRQFARVADADILDGNVFSFRLEYDDKSKPMVALLVNRMVCDIVCFVVVKTFTFQTVRFQWNSSSQGDGRLAGGQGCSECP